MTDIIWQQHNYHRSEPQKKLQQKHYGPEQPERIHFVSDDHIRTLKFSTQDTAKNFSTVNIKNKPLVHPESTVNTTESVKAGQNLLLDRRTNPSNKWSVATDDNQNPQVCFSQKIFFKLVQNLNF